jgi:hypothetical protein
MYQIKCDDIETLTQMVINLMKEGVGYEADTESLIIELTGGF